MSNITPQSQMKNTITQMKPEFTKLINPKYVDLDKFERASQTAILNDPYLMKADKKSLFNALLKCAETSLMPNGKEAALVSYGPKVTFIPMYEGLIKLISPYLKTWQVNLVREGDDFKYWVDAEGEHLHYVPGGDGFDTEGPIRGAYCQLIFKDGSVWIERMSLEQLEAIEKSSKAKNGPWKGPFREEMMKKSVFKRLFKRLPKGMTEGDSAMEAVAKAVEKDEEITFEEPKDVTPNEPEVKEKVAHNFKAQVTKGEEMPEPPPEFYHDQPDSDEIPI